MKHQTWKRSEIKQLKDIMSDESLYRAMRDRMAHAAKTLGKSLNSCYYMYYKGSKKPRKAKVKSVKVTSPVTAKKLKTTTLEFNLVSMRVEGTKLFIEIKA